jgi:methyltransferase (TIGR00027 family)
LTLTAADTAYAIATIRVLEGSRAEGERLFDDPYAPLFEAAGAHAKEATQRFVEAPNFVDAVRLRTRFIDDLVRERVLSGERQLVLLGAGFDMRALRIPEIAASGVRVFEVDVAPQLEKKRAILTAGGVKTPEWDVYVPCDFSAADFENALTYALVAGGFRRGAGALFTWEGVIAYIDDAAIDRTLRFIVDAGGQGSRVVFEGTPSRFDPDPIEARLKRVGFSSYEETTFDAAWRRCAGHVGGEPHPYMQHLFMGVATI